MSLEGSGTKMSKLYMVESCNAVFKSEEEPCAREKLREEKRRSSEQDIRAHQICVSEIENCTTKKLEQKMQVDGAFFNEVKRSQFKRNEIINKYPNFWINAIVNQPDLAALLDKVEEDCLHYLKELNVEDIDDDDTHGVRIKFSFDKNPYFYNSELVKEVHTRVKGNGSTGNSSKINWKKTTLSKRHVTNNINGATPGTYTLFSWFNDDKSGKSLKFARIIKDKLWKNPMIYFLGPRPASSKIPHEDNEESIGLNHHGHEDGGEKVGDSGNNSDDFPFDLYLEYVEANIGEAGTK